MYITSTVKARGTRLAKPVLCLGLMCLAFLTGINRVAEYRNHWSDVIAGFIIGISIAVFLVSVYLSLFFFFFKYQYISLYLLAHVGRLDFSEKCLWGVGIFFIVNFLRHIYVHSEMSNQKKELIKSSILIPLQTKLKSFIH